MNNPHPLVDFLATHSAINRSQFARECGMSRTMLDFILRGINNPRRELHNRIIDTMRHYGYKGKA
jgi:DNA-binding phage protein